jgi:hypothetical protein
MGCVGWLVASQQSIRCVVQELLAPVVWMGNAVSVYVQFNNRVLHCEHALTSARLLAVKMVCSAIVCWDGGRGESQVCTCCLP